MADTVTFELTLESGERVPAIAYYRSGKLVVQRLPPQNTRDGATGRVAEFRAASAEVAWATYGQPSGELPAAAAAVQRELPQRARAFTAPRRSKRRENQERYQSLLSAEQLERIRAALGDEAPEGATVPPSLIGVRSSEREAALSLPERRRPGELRLPERSRASARLEL